MPYRWVYSPPLGERLRMFTRLQRWCARCHDWVPLRHRRHRRDSSRKRDRKDPPLEIEVDLHEEPRNDH